MALADHHQALSQDDVAALVTRRSDAADDRERCREMSRDFAAANWWYLPVDAS
ncbi:hypothetical protein LN650_21530 [Klebsiella pneumoniae subsp. pneumoniae]|nr:hypothetical protein [Klebsiella pneumoniae subsp. pneumoniae]